MVKSAQGNRWVDRSQPGQRDKRIQRLLSGLEQGGPIMRAGPGYRLGRTEVAADEVDALVAADLASRCGEGHIEINSRGRAYLARLRSVRRRQAALRDGDSQAGAIHAPFRDQHVDICRAPDPAARSSETNGARREEYWINQTESPLGWLRRRRDANGRPLISKVQFDAGERLRTDFELAGISPRITASWNGMPANLRKAVGYKDLDPTETQMEARKRFNRAMAALGHGLGDIAVQTCCLLEGLKECERQFGWPPRSAKVVLALALDRLVDHYGLEKKNQNGK